jgi:O-antigen/teichoic acid export membrane protein
MISMPIAIGAYLLAYPIIFIVSSPAFLSRLNEGFYGSDIALKILIFASFFAYLNSIFGFTLVALNRQIDLLKITGACVIFNIVSNVLVIPTWGFRGAAFTSILSELFILLLTAWAVRKYIGFRISYSRPFRAFISALVMGGFILLLRAPLFDLIQSFSVIILIPLGGLVYAGMLLLTRAVTKDMILMVRGK